MLPTSGCLKMSPVSRVHKTLTYKHVDCLGEATTQRLLRGAPPPSSSCAQPADTRTADASGVDTPPSPHGTEAGGAGRQAGRQAGHTARRSHLGEADRLHACQQLGCARALRHGVQELAQQAGVADAPPFPIGLHSLELHMPQRRPGGPALQRSQRRPWLHRDVPEPHAGEQRVDGLRLVHAPAARARGARVSWQAGRWAWGVGRRPELWSCGVLRPGPEAA